MHPPEERVDQAIDGTSSAPSTPVRHDVADARSDTRKAVSDVLPNEVESRRDKSYRLAGGGWPVWR